MRHLVVDTRSPVPIYAQIVDQVREAIRSGSLGPGDPLPSVRQLASDLDVNPNTVAKAYLLLEQEGAVDTALRKGTFVARSARESARGRAERLLDDAADRLRAEAASLGMDQVEFLDALRRRFRAGPARTRPGKGGDQ